MQLVNDIVSEVHLLRTVLERGSKTGSLLEDRSAHNLPNPLLERVRAEFLSVHDSEFKRCLKAHINNCKKDGTDELGYTFQDHVDKILILYRGLLDVLAVHLGRLPTREQNIKTIISWLSLSLVDKLEDNYKFHSCYIFSAVTQQDKIIHEMPERPTWMDPKWKSGFILGGWFFRLVRKMIFESRTSSNPKYVAFAYALCNVKRAGQAISKKKIAESLEKHQKNMTGAEYKPKTFTVSIDCRVDKHVPYKEQGDRLEPIRVPVTLSKDDVLPMIKIRMTDIMERAYSKIRGTAGFRWRCPSVSACFEQSSRNGGTQKVIEDLVGEAKYRLRDPIKGAEHFIGFLCYRTKAVPIYVDYLPEDLLETTKEAARLILSDPNYKIHAQVHQVLEPFKARIITAGEGLIYQLGRCLQKSVHRALFEFHQMFWLIGQPCSSEFLTNYYSGTYLCNTVDRHSDMTGVCAGDYSSATDGMHPEISAHFVETYSSIVALMDLEKDVFRKCMEGHTLHYGGDKVVNQTHGQLMGSPLSFPILCVANAAVNWVACDLYHGKPVSFNDWVDKFRPLFNGDDTAFLTNKEHHDIWAGVASCAGFNRSIGKSYVTPDFIMINSEIHWLKKSVTLDDNVKKLDGCYRLGVLNPGLIKGQAKVIDDSRKSNKVTKVSYEVATSYEISDLGILMSMRSQLLATSNKLSLRKDVIEALFRTHTIETLKKSNRSWSLPQCFGGLGLSFGEATYCQRKLAARVLNEPWLMKKINSYRKETPLYVRLGMQTLNSACDDLGVSRMIMLEREEDKFHKERVFPGLSAVEPLRPMTLPDLEFAPLRKTIFPEKRVQKFFANNPDLEQVDTYRDWRNEQWDRLCENRKPEPDLSRYFLGGQRIKHGKDVFSRLLRESLKDIIFSRTKELHPDELCNWNNTTSHMLPHFDVVMC